MISGLARSVSVEERAQKSPPEDSIKGGGT